MNNWLHNLRNKLNKEAVEKLSDSELNSGLPPPSDPASGADPSGGDPSQMDPALGGMDPMSLDPSMMPPLPEPEPKVWDNKYLINCDKTKFIVELTPSIVMNPATDPSAMPPPPPPGMPEAQSDPMADQSLNPNADPEQLKQWMSESDDKDKPFSSNDKGTVDPLSKQQEGISDTGNEQSVKVHNKTSAFLRSLLKTADDTQDASSPTAITPGADRSNAYPPCKYCANYNAAENSCTQGLDVEKVQAAKSCSWLNSTMKPFKGEKDPDSAHKDEESVKSDTSQLPGGGGMGGGNADGMSFRASLKYDKKDKALQKYLDKIWD